MKPIPSFLLTEPNAEILRYVDGKSCHGDLAEPVFEYLRGYSDVSFFCPDYTAFHYMIWYRENTVFAAGTGMHRITVRLPDLQGSQATKDGVATVRDDLPGWYELSPFQAGFADWLLESYSAVGS